MTIKRFPVENLGRCEAVVSDGLIYAVATDPYCADGIIAQTKNTLDALASILERAGGGKAGLIQATIYLHDINLKRQMDTVWIEWIGPQENWPQRACVGAALSEGYLIEIVATAKIL